MSLSSDENKQARQYVSLLTSLSDSFLVRCRFCKKSFDSTFLLKQHRDTHFENLHNSNHQASKDLDENDVDDEPVLERTGFEEKLQETVYKISSYKDTYKCFQRYKPRLKRVLLKALKNSSVKFFVTMKVRMFKRGVDGSREYDVVGFYGGTYHCLTEAELDDYLNQTSQKLNSNFETFSLK